jgi:hypothetical protein
MEIRLSLVDEHFTIDKDNTWQPYGQHHKERRPMIYQKINPDLYYVFDGEDFYEFNHDEIGYLKEYNSEFVLIKEEDMRINKEDPRYDEYLELCEKSHKNKYKWAYRDFCNMAKELRNETNGEINMFKTGSHTTTALNLFHKFTQTIQPEHIAQDEAIWIKNATIGPIMYGEEYEGIAYKHDVRSFYPSILRAQNFSIPIKRGIFKNISEEEFQNMAFFLPGFYRVKIKGSTKCFRKNPTNTYTHFDLNLAKTIKG